MVCPMCHNKSLLPGKREPRHISFLSAEATRVCIFMTWKICVPQQIRLQEDASRLKFLAWEGPPPVVLTLLIKVQSKKLHLGKK
jgi:hypothetical protein